MLRATAATAAEEFSWRIQPPSTRAGTTYPVRGMPHSDINIYIYIYYILPKTLGISTLSLDNVLDNVPKRYNTRDIMDIYKENRGAAPLGLFSLYISIISLVLYLGIMPKCIYQEQKLPILEKHIWEEHIKICSKYQNEYMQVLLGVNLLQKESALAQQLQLVLWLHLEYSKLMSSSISIRMTHVT